MITQGLPSAADLDAVAAEQQIAAATAPVLCFECCVAKADELVARTMRELNITTLSYGDRSAAFLAALRRVVRSEFRANPGARMNRIDERSCEKCERNRGEIARRAMRVA